MKRVVTSIMLIITFALTIVFISAENETVDVVIHYQNWTSEYEGIGAHSWGGPAQAMEKPTGIDEFGIYFKFEKIPLGTKLGFIAVDFKNGEEDWDNKHTGDVEIDTSSFQVGETNHVYVFEGAETKENNPGYHVANNSKYNLIVVYADPSETYEENLGIHVWGLDEDTEEPSWGSPMKIFTNGASHKTINDIKVGLVSSTNIDLGMLIYAGGDGNKKTGDVTFKDAYEDEEDIRLGAVKVAYVYNAGDGNSSNENLFYNVDEFADAIFGFNFVEMGQDEQGAFKGTYAPNPTQIIAELSLSVSNPAAIENADEQKATELIKSWFTLTNKDGEKQTIEDVHYDKGAKNLTSFVLILKDRLDNQSEYNLEFNLGLEGDQNRQAIILVNMDKEAPKIQFISPSSFANETDPDKRIIEVEWDKKFDQNLFPRFIVTDNRDGDITRMVYVPKGEYSTLNTNVEGDYKIMLRVEDSWGNVTEETFIFRVTKKVK